MPVLLIYAYNPNTNDNKLYGLILKNDNDKEVWLASTIQTNDFQNWQPLISIGSKIGSGIWGYKTLIMQIKNDTIYIVDREQTLLFVIPLNQLSKPVEPLPLPAEVADAQELYQIESLSIVPNKTSVSLYLGAKNQVLKSDDEGRTWEKSPYWTGEDELATTGIIKANADIMVVVPVGAWGYIYVAPMGSANFQKYMVGDGLEIDAVFFNTYQANSKVLILMDVTGYIRTFNYTIENGKVIITPRNTLQSNAFKSGFDYTGNQVDATQFGGKLTIGFINKNDGNSYYYAAAEVNSNAQIIVKDIFSGFASVDGTISYISSVSKFATDTHGPLIYYEAGILYVSVDLGKTWRNYKITLVA